MSAPCPVFGFAVTIAPYRTVTKAQCDALTDDLIDVLANHGLESAGGAGDRVLEFIVNREGGQATHADRELIMAWASRWTAEADVSVGELVDLTADA